jgi:hypothetical protein
MILSIVFNAGMPLACLLLFFTIHFFDAIVRRILRKARNSKKGLFFVKKREPSASICQTCKNDETCVLHSSTLRPTFFCEQFDDSSVSREDRRSGIASTPQKNVDSAMGLCCNCGNTNSCKLPKVPGGIWHCEEYA